ncbi:hypothetical protein AB0H76_17560 [Nocardia sp. NPDC050712]|uniref:hypothetical protein n=1 Tax=Nocardia sp. NPDC050712 TaxID=3155518 RepID=UPI0033F8E5E2
MIDVGEELRADGERPNKQVRLVGDATVSVDPDEMWTRRIRASRPDILAEMASQRTHKPIRGHRRGRLSVGA